MNPVSRASHHAPAVRYPLARSRVAGWALAVVSAGGLAAWCGWIIGGTRGGITEALLGLGLWIATTWSVAGFWRRMPAGLLGWDGGQWSLETAQADGTLAIEGAPAVHLDLQWGLLLSVRSAQGRAVWLWLERGQSPQHWLALRCAVYSRARSDASSAADAGGTVPAQHGGT